MRTEEGSFIRRTTADVKARDGAIGARIAARRATAKAERCRNILAGAIGRVCWVRVAVELSLRELSFRVRLIGLGHVKRAKMFASDRQDYRS